MRTDPQLAEIIIKKMREIAEVDSQVGLAKILGVKSPTISGSIKAGRIPDRWFDVFESKFKKTKDDICAGLFRRSIDSYLEARSASSLIVGALFVAAWFTPWP